MSRIVHLGAAAIFAALAAASLAGLAGAAAEKPVSAAPCEAGFCLVAFF